jgi:hypothetical protein
VDAVAWQKVKWFSHLKAFYAVGTGTNVMRSYDGINWEFMGVGATTTWVDLELLSNRDGTLVAVSNTASTTSTTVMTNTTSGNNDMKVTNMLADNINANTSRGLVIEKVRLMDGVISSRLTLGELYSYSPIGPAPLGAGTNLAVQFTVSATVTKSYNLNIVSAIATDNRITYTGIVPLTLRLTAIVNFGIASATATGYRLWFTKNVPSAYALPSITNPAAIGSDYSSVATTQVSLQVTDYINVVYGDYVTLVIRSSTAQTPQVNGTTGTCSVCIFAEGLLGN